MDGRVLRAAAVPTARALDVHIVGPYWNGTLPAPAWGWSAEPDVRVWVRRATCRRAGRRTIGRCNQWQAQYRRHASMLPRQPSVPGRTAAPVSPDADVSAPARRAAGPARARCAVAASPTRPPRNRACSAVPRAKQVAGWTRPPSSGFSPDAVRNNPPHAEEKRPRLSCLDPPAPGQRWAPLAPAAFCNWIRRCGRR